MAAATIGDPSRGTRSSISKSRASTYNRLSSRLSGAPLPLPSSSSSSSNSNSNSNGGGLYPTPSSYVNGSSGYPSARRQTPNTNLKMRQIQQFESNAVSSGNGTVAKGFSLSEMMAANFPNSIPNNDLNNRENGFIIPQGLSANGSTRPSTSVSKSSQQSVPGFNNFGLMTPSRRNTPNGNNFSIPQTSSLTVGRDPRPLRDKNYISNIQQSLYDYLESRQFSQETNHPLTTNSLRKPTQKDFVIIFKWLYNRLDPGYKFTRSIENEVFLLLKALQYPYIDAINKSQISAVGGQNWPIYLGMLHWLMELNMTLEVFDNEDTETSEFDQIVNKHIIPCYAAFMKNDETESLQVESFLEDLDQLLKDTEEKIELVQEECKSLEVQTKGLDDVQREISILETGNQNLQTDISKYEDYNSNLNVMQEKWKLQLKALQQQIKQQQEEALEIEQEKSEVENRIQNQELKPQEIDGILAERTKITQNVESLTERIADIEKICHEKEMLAHSTLQDLESTINKYMKHIYSIRIDPESSLGQLFSKDPTFFTISIDSPLSDDHLGKPLSEEKRIQTDIRPQLLQYRHEISENIYRSQDEYLKLQETLDSLHESNTEKQEQAESLEAKIHNLTIEYDTLYETAANDLAVANAEIETVERKSQELKMNANLGMAQTEQKYKNVTMEYDELKRQVELAEKAMASEAWHRVSQVVKFKTTLMNMMAEHEKFLVDEEKSLEKELNAARAG